MHRNTALCFFKGITTTRLPDKRLLGLSVRGTIQVILFFVGARGVRVYGNGAFPMHPRGPDLCRPKGQIRYYNIIALNS